jgi:hemerythrin-like metal-binding protein
MKRIAWHDDLDMGNKALDEQHRRLVELVNGVLEAGNKGPLSQEGVAKALRTLREFSVYHFAEEEKFMRAVGFSAVAGHAEAHERMSRKLKDLQDDIYRKQVVTAARLKEILRAWLFDDVLKWDQPLAAHARKVRDNGGHDPEQPTAAEPPAEPSGETPADDAPAQDISNEERPAA